MTVILFSPNRLGPTAHCIAGEADCASSRHSCAGIAEQAYFAKQVPIPVFNRRTDDAVPSLIYTRCVWPLRA